MTPERAIQLGTDALTVATLLAGPILLAALIIGLIVGMFQAATQINEQTLSFVPKLAGLAVVLFLLTPWMTQVLTDFTEGLIRSIPEILR
ncbi:MAG: flagellar biosynthesis protein FliQ [Halorhodospira halophila]|uniref:flagellar biosynthesis protein FliQ n=1 Tax=Halorhodospira TaxID=85108 RepID=UPI001914C1F4|nr:MULTISPECIES: flagellar biosynthesis protein FliQ [Halorhodospira]MBK5936750.1 flagellar biosynthetic protein FliQ [Halorhodospira halophila]MBK5942806.1 flagellar biosynthetic protein FliQ [Halorhodospira halophila]MCC3751689.1 flagellar biosynthesis protein FliQ [Halorhodospira halophila]MCG5528825.1 flagellar biosynthesis protein FliQ [Halorhodospira halophila]MCG5533716.1 flagellar biosynthesis protein FliQ [Halorhodospira sp. 9621]